MRTALFAFALALAPLSSAWAQPAQETPNDLSALVLRIQTIESDLDSYRKWLKYGGSAVGVAFAIASFVGYSAIRRRIGKSVDRRLHEAVSTAVAEALPNRIEETLNRAEQKLLHLATVMALVSHHEYDTALSEFGWNGKVSSLREESAPLRRTIIDALHSARSNRKENREAAWNALTELLEDDSSLETLRLFFRICVSTRRFEEGLPVLDQYRDLIASDKHAALRAATLLRRLGRLDEAYQLAQPVVGDAEWDMHALNVVSAIQRDLGEFDEAHDLLRVPVERVLSSELDDLPNGWTHVLNSFIANCIDRRHPEDAIRGAELLLAKSPTAVVLATVARVAIALPLGNTKREELARKIEDLSMPQMPGEARTRCRVELLQLKGKTAEAIQELEAAIDEGARPRGEAMRNHVYFHRCTLGMLLSEAGQLERAADVLVRAANFNYGGEAKFWLAVVYAKLGQRVEAARWIREAIHELPKWRARARDNEALRTIPEVSEELARNVTPPAR